MPKYLELSANVNISSSSSGGINQGLTSKKLIPYIEDGEHQGYVITSPLTGRNLLIGKENELIGVFGQPTFARCITAPGDAAAGIPEECFFIMSGSIGYLDGSEIVGCMPMIDCTWEPEQSGNK